MHFAATVNRHPPITQADLDTILQTQIIPPQGLAEFTFNPTTEENIQTAINKLSAKSMGHDAISQQMLKLASPIVSAILTAICNCSFATSTFPTYWKKSSH